MRESQRQMAKSSRGTWGPSFPLSVVEVSTNKGSRNPLPFHGAVEASRLLECVPRENTMYELGLRLSIALLTIKILIVLAILCARMWSLRRVVPVCRV